MAQPLQAKKNGITHSDTDCRAAAVGHTAAANTLPSHSVLIVLKLYFLSR
jgi:hypothetical protein